MSDGRDCHSPQLAHYSIVLRTCWGGIVVHVQCLAPSQTPPHHFGLLDAM
jgi:hypothetical protein